jgi:hypothetical protein
VVLAAHNLVEMALNNKTMGGGNSTYWTEANSKKLYEHFKSGDFDPQNQESPYIKACYDQTE